MKTPWKLSFSPLSKGCCVCYSRTTILPFFITHILLWPSLHHMFFWIDDIQRPGWSVLDVTLIWPWLRHTQSNGIAIMNSQLCRAQWVTAQNSLYGVLKKTDDMLQGGHNASWTVTDNSFHFRNIFIFCFMNCSVVQVSCNRAFGFAWISYFWFIKQNELDYSSIQWQEPECSPDYLKKLLRASKQFHWLRMILGNTLGLLDY